MSLENVFCRNFSKLWSHRENAVATICKSCFTTDNDFISIHRIPFSFSMKRKTFFSFTFSPNISDVLSGEWTKKRWIMDCVCNIAHHNNNLCRISDWWHKISRAVAVFSRRKKKMKRLSPTVYMIWYRGKLIEWREHTLKINAKKH